MLGMEPLLPFSFNLILRVATIFLGLSLLLFSGQTCVQAHIAAWDKGMYCLNGTTGVDNPNTNEAVDPLFNLTMKDWWFHHNNNCDQFPPADGNFLELPANEEFTVELAVNRAFTTFSYDGRNTGTYTNGKEDPGYRNETDRNGNVIPGCITEPNIHAQNETMAAGTAFAISYTSDITQVTPETLVVFTVLYHSPWTRLATYQVPNLPACPDGGCICGWGWVPNGCGQPNIYMHPYRCTVTGTPGQHAIGRAKPPVWCEDDETKCVAGPKQMIFWNQAEGNNIYVDGVDKSGMNKSPTYNMKLGFVNGAQKDIFDQGSQGVSSTITTSTSTTTTSGTYTSTSTLTSMPKSQYTTSAGVKRQPLARAVAHRRKARSVNALWWN